MKHQLTDSVKLLQKAALIHNGACLVLQRSPDSKTRPMKWDLPGGNSEWPDNTQENHEDLHMADIAREIREETGIILPESEFSREKLVHMHTFFEAKTQVYSIVLGWRVFLPSEFDPNSVIISSEHVAAAWMRPEELDQYDFDVQRGSFLRSIVTNSF